MTFPLSDGTSHSWSRTSNGPELTSSGGKQGLNEPCMNPGRKDCSPLTLPQMHSTCQTGNERNGFVLQQCTSLAAWLNAAKIIAKKLPKSGKAWQGWSTWKDQSRWRLARTTCYTKVNNFFFFFQRDCAAVKEVRCCSLAKNISPCLKR